eukprot:3201985-Ditylum_brightwellii.AAC.1
MRDKELPDRLGEFGLAKRWNKPELLSHLQKVMHDKVMLVNTDRNNAAQTNSTPGFVEGTYWEELTLQIIPVEEPENQFQA